LYIDTGLAPAAVGLDARLAHGVAETAARADAGGV
jgi:hypothetical protein